MIFLIKPQFVLLDAHNNLKFKVTSGCRLVVFLYQSHAAEHHVILQLNCHPAATTSLFVKDFLFQICELGWSLNSSHECEFPCMQFCNFCQFSAINHCIATMRSSCHAVPNPYRPLVVVLWPS